jgi:hypothetical protein
MKKSIFFLFLLSASAAILPSCKKDYTCVCTVNGNEVYRNDLGKQTRSDAEDACNRKSISFGVIAKCEIE